MKGSTFTIIVIVLFAAAFGLQALQSIDLPGGASDDYFWVSQNGCTTTYGRTFGLPSSVPFYKEGATPVFIKNPSPQKHELRLKNLATGEIFTVVHRDTLSHDEYLVKVIDKKTKQVIEGSETTLLIL